MYLQNSQTKVLCEFINVHVINSATQSGSFIDMYIVIDITIWATGKLFVCFNYMFSRCSVAAVIHANKSVSMSSRHGRPHPHTWIVNCSAKSLLIPSPSLNFGTSHPPPL